VALTTDHRVGKVRSVTLPYQTDNGGLLHVFAMALK